MYPPFGLNQVGGELFILSVFSETFANIKYISEAISFLRKQSDIIQCICQPLSLLLPKTQVSSPACSATRTLGWAKTPP